MTPGPPTDARQVWDRIRSLVLDSGDRRRLVADALGMSFQRAKALRRIAEGPLALHELATDLVMDKPYTTVIVRDLVGRGLVETRPHPQDGRSKIVSVTAAGRELGELAGEILSEPPPGFADLAETDLAELRRILSLLGPG